MAESGSGFNSVEFRLIVSQSGFDMVEFHPEFGLVGSTSRFAWIKSQSEFVLVELQSCLGLIKSESFVISQLRFGLFDDSKLRFGFPKLSSRFCLVVAQPEFGLYESGRLFGFVRLQHRFGSSAESLSGFSFVRSPSPSIGADIIKFLKVWGAELLLFGLPGSLPGFGSGSIKSSFGLAKLQPKLGFIGSESRAESKVWLVLGSFEIEPNFESKSGLDSVFSLLDFKTRF